MISAKIIKLCLIIERYKYENYNEEDDKMPRLLSIEETINIIREYIEDDRKKQAILLNGEWGCGKTFFINNKLIPQINKNKFQIYQISLYGVSDIEKIQDLIYEKWIEKVVEDKTEKFDIVSDALIKRIELLGKNAIKFLENKMGTDGNVADMAKNMLEQSIGKDKKPLLIFDDIERCQIDIIELMGFLNNLSENKEYKIILVANEQEINRDEDEIAMALKYEIALNSRLDVENLIERKNRNVINESQKESDNKINREELAKITRHYFGRKTTYERTREKLIGLTVPYSISIKESFDEIISKYIKDKNVQKIVEESSQDIFDLFEQEGNRNLRTLIVSFIAIEDIISSIEQDRISDKVILRDELKTIVLYTVYSAIRRTNGIDEYNWPKNTRYGCVNNRLFAIQRTKIYGYAFVNEYWKTQCIDKEVVYADIQKVINQKVESKKALEQTNEHRLLALNSLYEWYLLQDDEVKQLILQMKKELEHKKYYPQEFKDIILTLMRINNPNFGLITSENQKQKGRLYDSTESGQFVGMSLGKQKEVVRHQYEDWEIYDISEFIDLMVEYLNESENKLTKEMICVLSEDKEFAYEYRCLTMPLIEMIERDELDDAIVDENGTKIFDMQWNEQLEVFCKNNSLEFQKQGKFLSLFEYNKLIEKFKLASPKEISFFCDAVENVYSFSNLVDFYSVDYEIVKAICKYKMESLNENKSRTKEIALRRLQADMCKYANLLKRKDIAE